MLDPNLNIWVLLLYVYMLYGSGYALGLAQSADKGNAPSVIAFCFTTLLWPFVKGFNDGAE